MLLRSIRRCLDKTKFLPNAEAITWSAGAEYMASKMDAEIMGGRIGGEVMVESLVELRKLVKSEVLESEVYVSDKLQAVARLVLSLGDATETALQSQKMRMDELEKLEARVQKLQALAMRVSKLEKGKPKKELVQIGSDPTDPTRSMKRGAAP